MATDFRQIGRRQHLVFITIISLIMLSLYALAQDKAEGNILQKRNIESLTEYFRGFYFDILPVATKNDKVLLLSFSNSEQTLLMARRERYEQIAEKVLDGYKGDVKRAQNNFDYIEAMKEIAFIDGLPEMQNPLWLSLYSESSDYSPGARVDGFNYATAIPITYSNIDGEIFIAFFQNKDDLTADSSVFHAALPWGVVFQHFSAIDKNVRKNLVFTDLKYLHVYNALGEELADLSKLKDTFTEKELNELISFKGNIIDNEQAIIVFGRPKEYESQRPLLPYSDIYYFDTLQDKAVTLGTLSNFAGTNESNSAIWEFVYPKENDIVTFSKPVIYKDKVLYWYAIESADVKNKTTYVLVCFDGETTNLIDATVLYSNTLYYYDVLYFDDGELVEAVWENDWLGDDILNEDTHIFPLVGLDANGKIVCYNPFIGQLMRFDL